MEKIQTPDVELGQPGLGQKPKKDSHEKEKEVESVQEEKKGGKKKEEKEMKYVTRSKRGTKLRVTAPGAMNRHEKRRARALMNRQDPETRKTKGAFGFSL